MSDDKFDFNLPDLPSDEELGISDEDYDLLDEHGEIRPEPPPGAAPKPSPTQQESPSSSGGSGAGGKTKQKKAKAPKRPKGPSFFERRRERKAERKTTAASKKPKPPAPQPTASTESDSSEPPSFDREPASAGAGGRAIGPVVLGLLILMGWVSTMERSRPGPMPANAPDTVFSSARAMTDMVEIARLPHPTGSPEHARVLSYLTTRFEVLDLEPEIQTATAMMQIGDQLRSATVRNLMARIPGTESTGAVLLMSHYDSRSQSRGAADAGVGVVTILEAVRALQAGPPMRNDLIVLLTDAEEVGLLGAEAFVDEHPWMDDVALVVNIEMRGAGGSSIMFETGTENGWVIRALQEATSHASANSMSEEVYKRLPNNTDFTLFRAAGKQGLNFASVGRPSSYHQRFDAPEHVDEATVQHHGEQVLGVLKGLVQGDLRSMDQPESVYFRVPFVGLIVYGDRWVIPLGMLLVLAAVGVFAFGRKRGLRTKGIAAGLVLAILATAISAATGSWLFGWLTPFHPEYGSLHAGVFHREGWYMLGLVAIAFTVVTALVALARRWFSVAELTLGGVLPALLAAVAMTIWLPSAAMNLQWPVAAALLAVAVLSFSGNRTQGPFTTILSVLLAAPVFVFLVFVIEGLWLAMTLALTPVFAGLLVVSLMLILPALDVLRRLNWWWSPVLGGLAAAGFVGMGILMARPAPDRPAPSTLLYTLDRETGVANWLTSQDTTPNHPGVAWVAERVRDFDGNTGAEGFYFGASLDPKSASEAFRSAPAEPIQAPEPGVYVVSDSVSEGIRIVTIAVTSNIVAERLAVGLPTGVTLGAVNGTLVPTRDAFGEPRSGSAAVLSHWGATDGGLRLSFEVDSGTASIEFALVEHLLRPAELLGDEVFRRPPELTPDIRRFSDRVVIRTVVRTPLGEGGGPMVITDPRTMGPDSSAAPPAPAEVQPDSIAARPGSPEAQPDSVGAQPDPVDTQPDSAGTRPDSSGPRPDSVGTEPDSTGAQPGSLEPQPDSTAARPDSSEVQLDSANAPADTSVLSPPSGPGRD